MPRRSPGTSGPLLVPSGVRNHPGHPSAVGWGGGGGVSMTPGCSAVCRSAVPIGLSPPRALPLPLPSLSSPPLLTLPFPWEAVPPEPPDCPCFTAPCRVRTEEG